MFNILFYFPSVRPVCDRRDYFSAPEGGKEQPDKAERRNTLAADGWEEDLSGSPLWRPAGIVRIGTAGYFRSKITPQRSHG